MKVNVAFYRCVRWPVCRRKTRHPSFCSGKMKWHPRIIPYIQIKCDRDIIEMRDVK